MVSNTPRDSKIRFQWIMKSLQENRAKPTDTSTKEKLLVQEIRTDGKQQNSGESKKISTEEESRRQKIYIRQHFMWKKGRECWRLKKHADGDVHWYRCN